MSHHLLLIVNPGAGAGRLQGRYEELQADLSRHGLAAEAVLTQRPGQAVELAREASGRFGVVVAVGGDGTVNEVASGLLLAPGPAVVLGIIPAGTGNDIATQLGLRSVDAALAALTKGTPRAFDAIEVTWGRGTERCRRFALSFAAAGFAGELIKRTTPGIKRLLGPRLCYSVGFVRALAGFDPPMMRVTVDGRPHQGRFFHVCAGNAEYAGGGVMRLSPGARMDDGQLNICLIERLGRLEALWHFPRLLRGTHITHPKVRYFTGQALALESDPATDVQLDGDLVGHTPATFQLRPGAIRVLVPPS
jgi:YegS/Rv2252/BmrU family lipid kinase